MKKINIPEGYQQVMPYLIIHNAAGFIGFMKAVFEAVEKATYMRTETMIMHGELSVGTSCIMFADVTDDYKQQNAGMFIYVENCDDIYKKALDHGATNIMDPADQEYGRSAGILDPFGNTWWITTA